MRLAAGEAVEHTFSNGLKCEVKFDKAPWPETDSCVRARLEEAVTAAYAKRVAICEDQCVALYAPGVFIHLGQPERDGLLGAWRILPVDFLRGMLRGNTDSTAIFFEQIYAQFVEVAHRSGAQFRFRSAEFAPYDWHSKVFRGKLSWESNESEVRCEKQMLESVYGIKAEGLSRREGTDFLPAVARWMAEQVNPAADTSLRDRYTMRDITLRSGASGTIWYVSNLLNEPQSAP